MLLHLIFSKRARGCAFVGAEGVAADGITKCFVRELSSLPPLLSDPGVLLEGFREEELQGVKRSTATGVSGVTSEKCSGSDIYLL